VDRYRAKDETFEQTDQTWSLSWTGADGKARELYAEYDEEGEIGPTVMVTVYVDTEHALMPLDRHDARNLAAWLVSRVGLPHGFKP
jgi:hypothetical protein